MAVIPSPSSAAGAEASDEDDGNDGWIIAEPTQEDMESIKSLESAGGRSPSTGVSRAASFSATPTSESSPVWTPMDFGASPSSGAGVSPSVSVTEEQESNSIQGKNC